MPLEKIKSFKKNLDENYLMSTYYLENKPLSWILLITILLSPILPFFVFFLYSTLSAIKIYLVLCIIYAASTSFWAGSILQSVDKNINLGKYFFLCSFWKGLFEIEQKFLKNKKISEIIKINEYYLKNKNRYKRLMWLLLLYVLAIPFVILSFSILLFICINLNLFRLNICAYLTLTTIPMFLFVPVGFVLTYLLTGFILLMIEKFKKIPDLKEDTIND